MQLYSARRSPASLILHPVNEPNAFMEERGFVSDRAMRTVKWAVPLKVPRALVLRSTPDRAREVQWRASFKTFDTAFAL